MKTLFKPKHLILIVVMLSLGLFTTCKKDPQEEPSDAVPETTVVIDEQTWETTYTGMDSTSKTLYFDDEVLDLTEIEPGDYIISTAGNGLLRKVSSVTETDDGYTVETEFASLTDVIYEGETSFNTVLSQQNIDKITYLRKGVKVDTSMMNAEKDAALEYNIDTYLDDDENIHVYGNFTLETLLEGELKIGMVPPRVKLFELSYSIDQDLFLASELDFSDVNYEDEVDLASITFTPIIAVMAGVPVLLVPELELVAGVEMGIHCDVYTDITQSMDYTIGIRYEDKQWNTINDFSKTFDYTSPIIDCSAQAQVYIKPQFNVKIFDVVSPYLFADLYARLDADVNSQPWWSLYGGADMGVGIEAEILGKEIFDFCTDPPLIAYEQLIASATGSFENPPVAGFLATPLSGNAPLEVAFTDESQNNPESWSWDFGDGNTSSSQNPTHIYNSVGVYSVTLMVTNSNGSDSETKTDYITVTDGGGGGNTPMANFTATPLNGDAPLQVSFTDASTNNPTSWSWNFGDGSTSALQNPSHTYTSQGQLSVSLTVSNDNGSDSETKTNYITVTDGGGGNYGEPCPGMPTMTDIDGNTYNTVLIGNQCWMKENLKVMHYPNGDAIPYITDNSEWAALDANNTDDAYCYYGNNTSSEYGALYSYAAAIADNWERDNADGQGICPAGWHLPTDQEWTDLEEYLIANGFNWDGSTSGNKIGKSLASTYGWNNSSEQGDVGNDQASNNTTGFTALPGGTRNGYSGLFYDAGYGGYWWSATEDSSNDAWTRGLRYSYASVGRGSNDRCYGFSVRCLRD